MAQAFFSVVIPTYNRQQDVARAVASVLAQTDQDFEIIVVDDAGTDDTEQQLAKFNDARISYVRQEKNAGAKAARNRGISLAKGKWLCLLDSDDEWLPHRLEYLRESIAKHPNAAGTVFWSSLIFNRGGGVSDIKPKVSKPEGMPFFEYLMCRDGLMQTSTLALSAAKAKEHPFNEAVLGHDDYEFLFGLEKAGMGFYQDTRPQVVWNDDAPPSSRVSFTNRRMKCEQWINVHGKDMSPKSLAAYKALHLAPCYSGVGVVKSLYYILMAVVNQSVGVRRGVLMVARVLLPPQVYAKVVSTLSGKGAL